MSDHAQLAWLRGAVVGIRRGVEGGLLGGTELQAAALPPRSRVIEIPAAFGQQLFQPVPGQRIPRAFFGYGFCVFVVARGRAVQLRR